MSSTSDRGGNPARRSAAPAQGGSPASEATTGWRALVARFQTPSWARAAWQLTSTLSVFGAYTYATNETDVTTGNVDETNNRLYFGVLYRGVGLRR